MITYPFVFSGLSPRVAFPRIRCSGALLLLVALLCAMPAMAQEPVPALPRVYIDTTWNPPTGGSTFNVNTSSGFQQALNTSQPGDTIVLQSGAVFSGNFTLPAKANPNHKWIYIESSAYGRLPAPGSRVGPNDAVNMAKIVTPNGTAPVTIAAGASNYRLVGLEVTTQSNQGCQLNNNPPVNCFTYFLVSASTTVGQPLADSITVDRSYIHGTPTQDVRQGVVVNGTNFAVIDSYISDIHQSTADSQGVLGYYTPGPIKIVDNFIAATTENIMFGGAGGYNNPYIPADIEIRNNLLFKPLSWDAPGITLPPNAMWSVKNNLEFKSAQRVLITGNTMQNNWLSAQTGASVLFTVRTTQSGNIAVVDDITFQGNLLTNVDAGFNTLEHDDQCSALDGYPNCTNPGEAKRIKIYDNLVLLNPEHNGAHHNGLSISADMTDFIFQHNTVLMADQSTCLNSIYFNVQGGLLWPLLSSDTHNVWVLDNALCRQTTGDWGGQGTAGLNSYMSDPSPLAPRYFGNAMFVPSGNGIATWPANNFATAVAFVYNDPAIGDYRLESPYWTDTTDGKVAGIDWASLQPTSTTVLTSTSSSLYTNQATTLTGTVSVAGTAGPPTGTVSFMLGTTLLGTGTLTTIDGSDASASIQVRGSQLSLGPNSIIALYSGDGNYAGSDSPAIIVTLMDTDTTFGPQNVGTSSARATVIYSFSTSSQLSAINILTEGAPGLDFADGGTSTCRLGILYMSGQICTVSVKFTPTQPGLRAGAVTLFVQGTTQPVMTSYVSGIGEAPAVSIDPGTQTTLGTVTNGATYGSAIDGYGNVYVADQANGQVVEIAARTQTQTVIVSQLSAPTSVGIDGAGNLYVAESTGVALIPNENGTLNPADMRMLQIEGLGLAQGFAMDSNGYLDIADIANSDVIHVPGVGGTPTVIASGLTNPHAVAVDAMGNIFVASDNQVSEYPIGGGTPIQLGAGYNSPQGIAVDASDTVYVADTGNARIVKVAPGGESQTTLAIAGLTAPHGIMLDATGDVYVSDSSNVYELNRVQAAALNFGQVQVGTTSPAQTLQVSNIGNMQLSASALAISANYLQQPSGGSDCSSSSQVIAGGGCAIAVAFSPTRTGVLNGAVTLTDNALNNILSQQSVALTGTGAGAQQQQTITFPNPGTQTYGVAPITLTATASSGLPVTYTVISGQAWVSGNILTITGAGSVTVQANQSGNSQWQAAPPVNDSFIVNPAVLTVTANNAVMTYGGAMPAFTASYNGFVNGDGQGALSGAPSLTTTATSNSPVGTYAIVASQGTLAAQNYVFVFVNGVLTIASAPSSSVLTSGQSSLYATQVTTLTTTVSVTGLGGTPTGTVNFMLGNTLLGTGTLAMLDGNDASASIQLTGSQLTLGPNSITAIYSGDNNYAGSTSPAITVTLLNSDQNFGSQNVGSTSAVQTLTYTFSSDTQLAAINILTAGTANLDYSDGGSSTCAIGTPYTAGQTCSVTVQFAPTAPGLRQGAVTLFAQGSNLPLMTWYLTGVGQSSAVTIDPGTQTTLGSINNATTYGSAIDGAGNVYVADQVNGQVVKIAAGTQTQTIVVSQLSAPTSVALDGSGNLYIAESSGVVLIPNENGTLNPPDMQTLQITGLGLAQGIFVDGNANLYVADSANGNVIEVAAGGGTPTTIASGLTNPHAVALDALGNVYVASDNQVTEYPAGGGAPIILGTGFRSPQGVAVDASGTIYVADTGNVQIVKVAPGGQSQSNLTVTGLTAPHGITLDASGSVYVSDGSNVYEVNRVQAAALNFGQVQVGTTSPAQTLQVSNIGNMQLSASALAISANYLQQPSGGSDCSASSQLVAGGGCAIAVAFSPTTTGTQNGTVSLTDNALNNPASQQTIGLTGSGTQAQQQQTITFPNPGTQTYGVAPITLTATASSGLPVTYTVISGPAQVHGNILTITGAGSVTVEADQSGNSQWLAAPPVDDTFTVIPAVLTVKANNLNGTSGQPLPTLTYTITGFVNGDTQSVVSGTPVLSTTATRTSPPGVYPITISTGTLAAQNYTFTFVNGTLTLVIGKNLGGH
jgi:sugar lactone lactonase YvrE